MSESQLVTACLKLCKIYKLLAWRNQAGVIARKDFFMRLAEAGTPDIFIFKKGKLYACECKVGKNKQSPSQIAWQKAFEKENGIYWLIYDLNELEDKLKSL